jgi:hypothetical protein
MAGVAGVTAIETSAGAMARLKEPFTESIVAVMETEPLDFAVNIPLWDTVARLVSDEFQATEPVKSFVEWSLKVPVALICSDWLTMMLALCALTAMDVSTGPFVVLEEPLPLQPNPAPTNPSTRTSSALRIEVLHDEGLTATVAGAGERPRTDPQVYCPERQILIGEALANGS